MAAGQQLYPSFLIEILNNTVGAVIDGGDESLRLLEQRKFKSLLQTIYLLVSAELIIAYITP